jgi:hypothetical protein
LTKRARRDVRCYAGNESESRKTKPRIPQLR